jgi:large conductance mechanosensitive channel
MSHGGAHLLKSFRAFLMRGNVLDLAVAFILGVAFASVVTAFVNIIMSFLAAIFGSSVSFDRLRFTLNGTPIPYGAFLTALVSFVLIGYVLFLIFRAYQRVNLAPPSVTRSCPYCKSSIAVAATRCPSCTSELAAEEPATPSS